MAQRTNLSHLGRVSKQVSAALGAAQTPGEAIAILQNIPAYEIPLAISRSKVYQLPMTLQAIAAEFGQAQVDLVGGGSTPNTANGVVSMYNDFTAGAALPAPMIILGMGVELSSENLSFAVRGNAVDPAAASKLSPDVYNDVDLITGGDLIPPSGGSSIRSAVLEWGSPGWRAAEAMADGYRARFRIGNTMNIIDEPLSGFASCGSDKYDTGFGECDVATAPYVQMVNDVYRSLAGSPYDGRIFVPTNAVRNGFAAAATNDNAAISSFAPSTANLVARAAWGAKSQHRLYTNQTFRIFDQPIFMDAGLPFQFHLEEENDIYLQRATAQLAPQAGLAQGSATAAEWDPITTAGKSINTRDLTTFVYRGGLLNLKTCFYGISLEGDMLFKQLTGFARSAGLSGIVNPQTGKRYGLLAFTRTA